MLITLSGRVDGLKVMDVKGRILKDLYTPCYTISKLKTIKGDVLYQAQYSFIQTESIKLAGGDMASMIYVKSPKGKKMNALLEKGMSAKFLINKNLYTLDQAKKFVSGFTQNLSVKQGVGRGNYYDVKGVGVDDYVFWFGEEPAILPNVGKSKVASSKYTTKSISSEALGSNEDKLVPYVKVISAVRADGSSKPDIINLDDAVLTVNGVKLEASKALLDRRGGKVTAKDVTIYLRNGEVKKYSLVNYDASKNKFVNYEYVVPNDNMLPKVVLGPGKVGDLELSKDVSISKMRYQASDSVIVNTVLESMLLSGKAELDIEKYKAKGKVIHLDNLNKMVTIYLGYVKDENNLKIEAEVIEIDLKNNRYITKNYFR